jgi:hypothetical protein
MEDPRIGEMNECLQDTTIPLAVLRQLTLRDDPRFATLAPGHCRFWLVCGAAATSPVPSRGAHDDEGCAGAIVVIQHPPFGMMPSIMNGVGDDGRVFTWDEHQIIQTLHDQFLR